MPKISKYTLQISLCHRLIAHCIQQFLVNLLNLLPIFGKELTYIQFYCQSDNNKFKSTLQKRAYLKKHSTYTQEVLKSTLNIQKSPQKHSTYTSKVLKSTLYIQKSTQKQSEILCKYSSYLLFPMYIKLFTLNIHTKFSQSNI